MMRASKASELPRACCPLCPCGDTVPAYEKRSFHLSVGAYWCSAAVVACCQSTPGVSGVVVLPTREPIRTRVRVDATFF